MNRKMQKIRKLLNEQYNDFVNKGVEDRPLDLLIKAIEDGINKGITFELELFISVIWHDGDDLCPDPERFIDAKFIDEANTMSSTSIWGPVEKYPILTAWAETETSYADSLYRAHSELAQELYQIKHLQNKVIELLRSGVEAHKLTRDQEPKASGNRSKARTS